MNTLVTLLLGSIAIMVVVACFTAIQFLSSCWQGHKERQATVKTVKTLEELKVLWKHIPATQR